MADELLLSFYSATSRRRDIVSDEGDSIWLYLTGPDSERPVRDFWLLNTPAAAAEPDRTRYRESKRSPPAPASIIDRHGVQDCGRRVE